MYSLIIGLPLATMTPLHHQQGCGARTPTRHAYTLAPDVLVEVLGPAAVHRTQQEGGEWTPRAVLQGSTYI